MHGICSWCQDEITPGELYYTDGSTDIHDDCMADWLMEGKGLPNLAWQYGLLRKRKGEEMDE